MLSLNDLQIESIDSKEEGVRDECKWKCFKTIDISVKLIVFSEGDLNIL